MKKFGVNDTAVSNLIRREPWLGDVKITSDKQAITLSNCVDNIPCAGWLKFKSIYSLTKIPNSLYAEQCNNEALN